MPLPSLKVYAQGNECVRKSKIDVDHDPNSNTFTGNTALKMLVSY